MQGLLLFVCLFLPVLEHRCRALHHVRQTGHYEPPPGDGPEGVGEARRKPEVDVLDQDLLEDLKEGDNGDQTSATW